MPRDCLSVVVLTFVVAFCSFTGQVCADQVRPPKRVQLMKTPAVSPDGSRIAFSWLGEIWSAKTDGTDLKRLTVNDADDRQPLFSPTGDRIAFVSNRTGADQIWVMNADGTSLRQATFHSAGYELSDWFPDGNHVLAIGSRDHFHRDSTRMIRVNVRERQKEIVLADAMAEHARVSPNGKHILFTREGERWWRKGYEGERSTQIWILDVAANEFTELIHGGVECMWPNWTDEGSRPTRRTG